MTRVLVISRECWRSDSNEGSVLTSLFAGQPFTVANVYCKPGVPDNGLCARSFQMTDGMALRKLLHGAPIGREVAPEADAGENVAAGAEANATASAVAENRRFYDFFRRYNLESFHLARELLWSAAGVQSEELAAFVRSFAPDVIFAPLCYSRFVLAVQRFAIRTAGCPAATYLYDDLYSLRQFRFSPFFWINRFALRRAIRKTLPLYAFAYTMSREQAEEYGKWFSLPMRVLQKCADTDDARPTAYAGGTLKLLYAGGIYYGRDRVLTDVSDAVRQLNAAGKPCRLDVYTNSPLSARAKAALDDGAMCSVHPAVPRAALAALYQGSDAALHVESFRRRDASTVRLSFSAKIVDCLSSGCAVLAVGPAGNAGFRYLLREDAALCLDDPKKIGASLAAWIDDPAMVRQCAKKALSCARRNHDADKARAMFRRDLCALAAGTAEEKQ